MKNKLSIYYSKSKGRNPIPQEYYNLCLFDENLNIITQIFADTLKVETDEYGFKYIACFGKRGLSNLIYVNSLDCIKYDCEMRNSPYVIDIDELKTRLEFNELDKVLDLDVAFNTKQYE